MNIRSLMHALDAASSAHEGSTVLKSLAEALKDYVRWSEYTVFPLVTEGIERQQSKQLTKLTNEIEMHRKRRFQKMRRSENNSYPNSYTLFSNGKTATLFSAHVFNSVASGLFTRSIRWLNKRVHGWREF